MTDIYGIKASALAGLHVYEQAARQSGRTSRMIERVTSDDQIVVLSDQHKHVLQRLLREQGKMPKIIVCSPAEDLLRRVGTAPRGTTHFEHDWVYQLFVSDVEATGDRLKFLEEQTSGIPRATPIMNWAERHSAMPVIRNSWERK